MTQEFKPGDVVRMRSGSPDLVVMRVEEAQDPGTKAEWVKVTVVAWDFEANEPREHYFPDLLLYVVREATA